MIVNLGEIAIVRNGAGIKQEFFTSEGIPLARVTNFTDTSINLLGCVRVCRLHAKKWQSYFLKNGDILVATVGSWPPNWSSVVGKTVRVPLTANNAIQNQNTCCVIAKPIRANQDYIYYLLRTKDFIQYAANSASGSANQARLSVAKLEQFTFDLPPIETQEKIGQILSALDDRITLLRETNATLEAIAQALFKSWFVDFDPVHAKAQGRQPEGMDEQTAALFPDRFVESELGMVPLGWEVVELVEISEILNGYAFKSEDYIEDENGVFVLRTTNFSDDGYAKRLGKDVFLPMSFTDTYSKYLCEPFDFHLVMVGASVGKTSTLLPNMLPALRNQNMWCFRPKNGFPSRFFIHETVKLKTVEALRSTSGSAREFLRKGDFEKGSVKLPTNDILAVFENTTLAIKQTIAINESQAQILANLRDTLLPRLISGQLRLPDVEEIVG